MKSSQLNAVACVTKLWNSETVKVRPKKMLADRRIWQITVPISGNFFIRFNWKETEINSSFPQSVAQLSRITWRKRECPVEKSIREYIDAPPTGHINVSWRMVNVPFAESLFQVPKIDYAQDTAQQGRRAGLTRRMSDLAWGLPLGKQLIQNHGHNLCKLLYRQDGSAGQKALTKCCHVYAWAASALLLIFLLFLLLFLFLFVFVSAFLCWFSPIAFIPSIPAPLWIELSLYTCRISQ